MKKVFLSLAFVMAASAASAQVLFNKLLEGYGEGDTLEKGQYESAADAAVEKSWMGAFNPKGNTFPSPVTAAPLTYQGYNEGGVSIKLGSPDDSSQGTHLSAYCWTNTKSISRKVHYLSFLLKIDNMPGNDKREDLVALNAKVAQVSARGLINMAKASDKEYNLGLSLSRLKAACQKNMEVGKTYLVVFKFSHRSNSLSLYINPNPAMPEPETADCILTGDEKNALRNPILSLIVKNTSEWEGNIGNFRLSNSWDGIAMPI